MSQEKLIFSQLVPNFADFWQNNIISISTNKSNNKIAHLKISAPRKDHVSIIYSEFCQFSAE